MFAMDGLRDQVALVTGASRGIGKGIALGLGEAGATVYVTGRSTRHNPAGLPGTVEETAAEVTRLGGHGIAVRCDHRVDVDVATVFERIGKEHGRLDLLVNNAFASPEQRLLWSGRPFWELPMSLWDDLNAVGLRSHLVASRCAVPLMLERGTGTILNVSSHSAGVAKSAGSKRTLPYSVVKAALQRLSADMATELREFGIAVLSIWPPATKTEGVLAQPEVWGDLTAWNSPLFTGRVVAAFLGGGNALAQSGESIDIQDLAEQLGIFDQPT
jgi:dehydrogenase/reductase SDR family protein 1